MQLLGCGVEQLVEFGEEGVGACFFVGYGHALEGEFYDVDGGEGYVASSD